MSGRLVYWIIYDSSVQYAVTTRGQPPIARAYIAACFPCRKASAIPGSMSCSELFSGVRPGGVTWVERHGMAGTVLGPMNSLLRIQLPRLVQKSRGWIAQIIANGTATPWAIDMGPCIVVVACRCTR